MESRAVIYQKMSALSGQMVEAVHAGDCERLCALENSQAELRDALIAKGGGMLSEGEIAQTTELIQKILDDNAEVRRLVEPWKKDIRLFLGNGVTRRRVAQAYGIE